MGAILSAAQEAITADARKDTVEALTGRGITLRQALSVYQTALDKNLVNRTCTTELFWKKVLKPLTKDLRMSYTEFCKVTYKAPLRKAQVHIVHSWSMKHCDTLTAAAEFLNELHGGPKPDVSLDLLDIAWHEKNMPDNLDVPMFICTYVVDQYSLKDFAIGDPKCQIDKFDMVAQNIHKTSLLSKSPLVIATDDEGTAMSRSLCLEEIHCAIRNSIPLHFCGTGSLVVEDIDAQTAKAYDKEVEENIRQKILKLDGGFDGFNEILNNHLEQLRTENCRLAQISIGGKLDHNGEMYVLIGNPGAGKSTILNSLIRKVMFRSGVSYGHGLTTALQKIPFDGKYYVDTPGLADTDMKEKAAKEIEIALRQDGKYYIFFVVTLDKGRVRPADTATMKIVLDAAPIKNYAVIINEVHPRVRKGFEQNPETYNYVKSKLMAGLEIITDRFYLLGKNEELEHVDDAMWDQLPSSFIDFVHGAPGMFICSGHVDDLAVQDMSEIVARQEETNRKMEVDKEFLEEENQRQQEALLAIQKERDSLIERHVSICTKSWWQGLVP